MANKSYVLEVVWNSESGPHVEFGTTTLESDIELEMIFDPDCDEASRKKAMSLLESLTKWQKSISNRLVRFYRVLYPENGLVSLVGLTSEAPTLNLMLKPIIGFDDKGNPVPIEL